MAQARPHGTVVVAEDDYLIRIAAVDALQDSGFSVVESESADEAIRLISADPSGVLALFTDIHMPGGMNGLQLARHVHEHWPWIAVVVASGQATPGSGDLPLGSRFMRKPYGLDDVVRQVQALTDGSTPPAGDT